MLLLLLSCIGKSPSDTATPTLPSAVLLGEVALSGVCAGSEDPDPSQILTLSNPGDEPLQVLQVELLNGAPFAVSDIGAVLIPPGDSTDLTVTCAAEAVGTYEDTLRITTNDPVQPVQELPLSCVVCGPALLVSPDPILLAAQEQGCSSETTVTLQNVGDRDLTIHSVAVLDPSLSLSEPGEWVLAPLESVDLTLGWSPVTLDPVSDLLTVQSDDPASTETTVPILGEGLSCGEGSDTFTHVTQCQMDVILAVDSSASMHDELPEIYAHIGAWAEAAASLGTDYQLSVLDLEGCALSPSLSAGASAAEAEAWLSSTGVGPSSELVLYTLAEALEQTSGCNAGLLREGATLHLVGITDEYLSSVEPWGPWYSRLEAAFPDTSRLRVSGVSSDTSACGETPVTALYELSVATQGLYLSTCADWSVTLAQLGSLNCSPEPTPDGVFELSGAALAETLTVTVDGELWEDGWTYDPSSNSVTLDPSALADGAQVVVDYSLDCCPG